MSPSALIRASGLGTLVGGAFFAFFPLLHPDHTVAGYTSLAWVTVHLLPNVGAILVLFGLMGLLVRQLERAGLFGVVAFVVAFFGTASFVMGAMIEMFIIPFIGLQSPDGAEGPPPPGVGEAFLVIMLVFALGHLLLGLATYRARVLARSVGTMLIVGAIAQLILPRLTEIDPALDPLWVIGPVLHGVALAWLGYVLWSGTPERHSARSPRIVSPRLAAQPPLG